MRRALLVASLTLASCTSGGNIDPASGDPSGSGGARTATGGRGGGPHPP